MDMNARPKQPFGPPRDRVSAFDQANVTSSSDPCRDILWSELDALTFLNSSNTALRTELRWKKCSIPLSSRMKPNPLSIRSRAIVPVGRLPEPSPFPVGESRG